MEAASYIRDIYLDVFHARLTILPQDASTFYRLIKIAVTITITTEAACVEQEWLDDDDELLKELFVHIANAR